MRLLSGSSNQKLAQKIIELTGIKNLEREIYNFMDGEIKVSLQDDNLNRKHIIILQTLSSSNHLIELCLLIDALKNANAKKISLVIPYFFYTRQDKPKPGEAFSPKVIIKILETSGINDITFLDLHSTKIENLFSIPTKKLEINTMLKDIITKDSIIVAPDFGGIPRSENIAKNFNLELIHVDKIRLEAGKVSAKLQETNIKNKNCLIIDDIIDSGNTICETARILKDHGAQTVKAFCTHGVLSKDSLSNITNSYLDHLFITNSIDTEEKIRNVKKISVIDIAPLIAKSIE
ncbi:MAG: ribose-phosphate pyrophosphokinase [Rickettsiales bacterium]|nr:ribose-phosphate pyrophosphokinase [Rickettsiales bacterium]